MPSGTFNEEEKLDVMTEALVECYLKQNNRVNQMQILSLFAHKFSKHRFIRMMPGMNAYKIDVARKHAAVTFPGQIFDPPRVIRPRLSMPKVMHFLEFISSPTYHQAVGYGTKTLTLSPGLEIQIHKIVRIVIASRLINSCIQYCNESNNYVCLSRATLFKILKVCAASQKRNMHGLDNITSEDMKAVDVLEKVVSKLELFGLQKEKVTHLHSLLSHVNQHLKFEMKGHVQNSSACPEHCSVYSLSDPTNSAFKSQCGHEHNQCCCDNCSATIKLEKR